MPKTVDKYDKERNDILIKLFNILDINESNNKFSLHKMDADTEKQKAILELEPEIKKYFICSDWTCFKGKPVKRKWLSMTKYLIKEMNYTFIQSRKVEIDDDSPSKTDTYYNIFK
jgi:hypothetical protein